jgi:transcriptional regulatory protein RtcR
MILRAIEERKFLPVGSDKDVASDFQLIAGTNCDLGAAVPQSRFREDLFARLNLWTFTLPGLAERREDIEPNLDFELDRFAQREGNRVSFNAEARTRYLNFATAPDARWPGNFRDLAASITRMATLASSGRIDTHQVDIEIDRLQNLWRSQAVQIDDGLSALIDPETLDPFDRIQLAEVIRICRQSRSLSEAGRTLFAKSRTTKTSANDADRLGKYLRRFGLNWTQASQQ